MASPSFRVVCVPSALDGVSGEWAREMLQEGEIALLPDSGGLEAISDVAHQLRLLSVSVVRTEPDEEHQHETVMAYARELPLVWIAESFGPRVTDWARDRGQMTLLVRTARPLDDDERRRINRFVATLGRQSE